MTILFNNVSTNSTSIEVLGDGGPRVVFVRADDFGSATVCIEIASPSDPDERFEPLQDGEFTTDGEVLIQYLPPGTKIKARISRSTSDTSNIFVEIL